MYTCVYYMCVHVVLPGLIHLVRSPKIQLLKDILAALEAPAANSLEATEDGGQEASAEDSAEDGGQQAMVEASAEDGDQEAMVEDSTEEGGQQAMVEDPTEEGGQQDVEDLGEDGDMQEIEARMCEPGI